MSNKRVTIYDLAKELGISPSYISKALNNHASISEKVRATVKKKAAELNYKHNSQAANLRQGFSKTIGVIVPHINQSFFSEAIGGIEEACFENNHSLIICQSHESFQQECKSIDTLIHQNVDCILISVSAQTTSASHLLTVQEHNIALIQFDRHIEVANSYKVLNDNEEASYQVTKHLLIFKGRKEGYLRAIREAKLVIPYNFIVDNVLQQDKVTETVSELLRLDDPPDAFVTISDHQSLGVLQVAEDMGVLVPAQLGIFGFANEAFTNLIRPALSSVNQNSKDLGRKAANVYFQQIKENKLLPATDFTEIISCDIIARRSSQKSGR
jgi:DNA-binding LacI/PurR family transcriptional regulator